MVTALLQFVRVRWIFNFNRRGTSPTPPAKHLTTAAIIAMACITLLATACRSNSTAATSGTADVRTGSLAVAAQEGGGTGSEPDVKAVPDSAPTLYLAGNLGGHCMPITCMDFSPDGKLLASGSKDGTVRVWDVATGKLVEVLSLEDRVEHPDVHDIEFSPDGTKLACGAGDVENTDKGLFVWNVADWTLHRQAETKGAVLSVSWSPDNVAIAIEVVRWEGESKGDSFSNVTNWRGRIVIAVSGVVSNEIQRSSHVASFGRSQTPGARDYLPSRRPMFVPSRDLLFYGHVKDLEIIDPHTMMELKSHRFGSERWDEYQCVEAFSSDGAYLAAVIDGVDTILSVGSLVSDTENAGSFQVSGFIGFLPGGRVLACEDGKLRIVTLGNPNLVLPVGTKSFDSLRSPIVSRDGAHLAYLTEYGNEIVLVSLTNGEERRRIGGHAGASICVVARPGTNHVASGGSDGSVCLWDAESVSYIRTMRGGGTVKVGEVETTRPYGHGETVHAVTFSADGKLLASGSADRRVILWDPNTGEALQELKGHHHTVTSLAFNPDGKLIASGSDDCTVRVWEVETGKQLMLLRDMNGPVASVVFSADGKLLLAGGTQVLADDIDGRVLLWSASDGSLKYVYEDSTSYSLLSAAFGASGELVWAQSDNSQFATAAMLGTSEGGLEWGPVDLSFRDHLFVPSTLHETYSPRIADVGGIPFALRASTSHPRPIWAFNRIAANADRTRFILAGDPEDPLDTIQVWRIKQ